MYKELSYSMIFGVYDCIPLSNIHRRKRIPPWEKTRKVWYEMKAYQELTKEELLTLKAELNAAYEDAKGKGLKLDMSRGKPAVSQLDLTLDYLDFVNSQSAM